MVNAGLEGFVRAAALEMPLRINDVSPPWVKETMVKLGMDPTSGLASAEVAKAYVATVEGSHRGVILDPRSATAFSVRRMNGQRLQPAVSSAWLRLDEVFSKSADSQT